MKTAITLQGNTNGVIENVKSQFTRLSSFQKLMVGLYGTTLSIMTTMAVYYVATASFFSF